MQYIWNNFVLSFFKASISLEQSSALFPILSVIYITLIFYIFEKRAKSLLLSIPISTLSFVDDGLLISQEKSYEKLNANLFCGYNIISSLFNQFSLVIEHNKSEIFYFSRSTKSTHSLLLDLRPLKSSLLHLKDIWRYLGLFFNKKLFQIENYLSHTNDSSIGHIFYPLPYMDFNYGISKKYYYSNHSKN